jgi:MOSC domain-containing protein YiiM
MARLLSVNVGLPRDIEWKGRTLHTGIWKDPAPGRCLVGRLNLEGDGQGDLVGHGGEQRAVFVYQIESYRYWQEQLKRTDFVYGQFSENFTIEGLPDDAVCIGDRYQIDSALFEVTQPRVTCYRVGIRMNEPRMPALLTSSGRPGFYFRVLREGEVGAGDEIVKVGEAEERMTVAEINALLYSPNHARDQQQFIETQGLVSIWRGQSWQALTKDLPAAIRVQTEELANRKNQLDCNAFPRQVGQVSPVSVMRFIRLPTAGHAGRLQQPSMFLAGAVHDAGVSGGVGTSGDAHG